MSIQISNHNAIVVTRTARGFMARSSGRSMRVPYDYSLSGDDRYIDACQALANREGWTHDYVGSELKYGMWVFVPVQRTGLEQAALDAEGLASAAESIASCGSFKVGPGRIVSDQHDRPVFRVSCEDTERKHFSPHTIDVLTRVIVHALNKV